MINMINIVGKIIKVNAKLNGIKFISNKKTIQVCIRIGYYLITDIIVSLGEVSFVEILFGEDLVLFNKAWFRNIEIM
jgi:hypothetical protein